MTVTDDPIDVTATEPPAPPHEQEQSDVEVVAGRPSTPMRRADSALDRAAEAALTMPGLAGRDEFLALAAQARLLSMSPAAPKPVRGNPYLAFHICLLGRSLGIDPAVSLNLIDVIGEGDRMQLSPSPELLNGRLINLGLGRIRKTVETYERCVVEAVGPGGEVLGDSEFTWKDAQLAGLAGRNCTATEHKNLPNKDRCPCHQGYRTYPKRMLYWRACSLAQRDWLPNASVGTYSPEELGAMVDDQGRALDPATVELPTGYDPPARGKRGSGDGGQEGPMLADESVRSRLGAQIKSLPDPARKALSDRWTGRDGESEPLHPLSSLPAKSTRRAEALVKSFLDRAQKGEWGEWQPPADPETGEVDADPPEPAATPGGPAVPVAVPNVDPDPEATPDAPPEGSPSVAPPNVDGQPAPGPAEAPETGDVPDAAGTVREAPAATEGESVSAIEEVAAMSDDEVRAGLEGRGLEVKGNGAARRQRLALVMLREATQAIEQARQ